MHPSSRLLSARVHQPLIKFIGKRSWPSDTPHAHPAAPPELKKSFSEFVKKFQASASSSTSTSPSSKTPTVYPEFWQAPERFWKPRVRQLDDYEIDAILSGGASLR